MKGQNLKFLQYVDNSWTVFLDRDGVINKKIEDGYVLNIKMFEFLEGVLESLVIISNIFKRVIITTNQRGIGRGLMTEEDLNQVHNYMIENIHSKGGRVDAIFYCPHDYEKEVCNCRKPKIGMALQAKNMFPDIDFKKSIMIGDSKSDMAFAKNIGAIGIYIGNDKIEDADVFCFESLKAFTNIFREV